MSYDRANVGMIDLDHPAEPRTTIIPSGGTAYTIPAPASGGACVTTGQAGWNGTSVGFPVMTESTWTPASLNPGGAFTGKRALIDVAYGTDALLAAGGFRFDHVTLTNFELQEGDTQSDTCGGGGGNLPPIALADAATTPENQPVNIDVLENDSDPNGDPAPADTLTISAISDPPRGTATLNTGGAGTADDTIDYAPDTCFFGTDVFTYTVTDPGGLTAVGTVSVNVAGNGGDCFKTVTPCRIYDSREIGDPLTSGTPRDIQIVDLCGIPPSASAVSLNVTIVNPTGGGFLKVYPGTTEPNTSTLNFSAGQTRANNAIVGLLDGMLRVKSFQADGGTADVVIDVNGYTEQVPN
jgi:hypothetical protein